MNETAVIPETVAAILRAGDEYTYLEHLSPGLQMVYATRHLENEVRRTGFESYFARTGGHLAVKAMQGYELIGAERHAALVEEALAVFLRRETTSSDYAILDELFRDLVPPGRLKLEYLREHPKDFAAPH